MAAKGGRVGTREGKDLESTLLLKPVLAKLGNEGSAEVSGSKPKCEEDIAVTDPLRWSHGPPCVTFPLVKRRAKMQVHVPPLTCWVKQYPPQVPVIPETPAAPTPVVQQVTRAQQPIVDDVVEGQHSSQIQQPIPIVSVGTALTLHTHLPSATESQGAYAALMNIRQALLVLSPGTTGSRSEQLQNPTVNSALPAQPQSTSPPLIMPLPQEHLTTFTQKQLTYSQDATAQALILMANCYPS
ncbi:hypothetical protein NDU88_002108 [Pleurodeles waltl]|uniref:Uncharacterized protein n=1 Tax=Pleurodeles waltl TaxID=8319 RepID=A0AAV7LF10_PLEWA|nr:hypothetical protein NDU88_002108 [Pleurodeles waltl]